MRALTLTAAALLAAFLLLRPTAAHAQTPEQRAYRQKALIADITRQGARAEALVEHCTAASRPSAADLGMALNQWRDRNRWPVIQSFWTLQPRLSAAFDQTRSLAASRLSRQSHTVAATCTALPATLRSPSSDPSVHNAVAIAALSPASSTARPAAGQPTHPQDAQPVFRPSPPSDR